MAILSISEAARTWRMGRTTIQRAIREGRLSAAIQLNGSKGIDTSEMVRVFGEPCIDTSNEPDSDTGQKVSSVRPMQVDTETTSQHDAPQAVAALQAQIRLLEAQLVDAHDRELWFRRQLEEIQRLLPAPTSPPKPAPLIYGRVWFLLALLVSLLIFAGFHWWDSIKAIVMRVISDHD